MTSAGLEEAAGLLQAKPSILPSPGFQLPVLGAEPPSRACLHSKQISCHLPPCHPVRASLCAHGQEQHRAGGDVVGSEPESAFLDVDFTLPYLRGAVENDCLDMDLGIRHT